jgi:hypothetical protein
LAGSTPKTGHGGYSTNLSLQGIHPGLKRGAGRFGNKIHRPVCKALDRDISVSTCCATHHHNGQKRIAFLNFLERLEAAQFAHEDIQQHQVEFLGSKSLQGELTT